MLAPSRLPSFHTCVGANEERLTPKWYKEHGAEHQALQLEEFGVAGSDAENVCYLRDLADATRLVDVMKSCTGGNAVVIGGGYIGMECAASLWPVCSHQRLRVIMKIITSLKGVKFIKGTALSSFDIDDSGKVTAVTLRDGNRLPADMVVVGIGIRPNTGLFEGQLTLEKGGIKVNGWMQSSNSSVYAVGDVAAFPVKLFGETRRLEHVDSARKSARHAVTAIMEPAKTSEFDYLPFFYSRVFTLSWQFYGDSVGEVVHYGDFSGSTFGAYWVSKGQLVGSFLEGGTKEEYEAIAKATKLKPDVEDLAELERQGLGFALAVSRKPPPSQPPEVSSSGLNLQNQCMLGMQQQGDCGCLRSCICILVRKETPKMVKKLVILFPVTAVADSVM
ncbi:Monodehydroascorbate reductase 4, peroxisomal [Vitis vinifera]|uniref:monodehydroascorbate reductase (NADH) n=1 Tax=Vitis vinifera TaxID=29760 RepID=A0A438EFX3_VITVI|nr:Monodehydroascorbate reductase 4, peroxisomal [Vitis vinifera]